MMKMIGIKRQIIRNKIKIKIESQNMYQKVLKTEIKINQNKIANN